MINKGRISAILQDGKMVSVKPSAGNGVTVPLVVPALLRDFLDVDTEIVYVVFPDNTGIVLSRADGEVNLDVTVSDGIKASISGDDVLVVKAVNVEGAAAQITDDNVLEVTATDELGIKATVTGDNVLVVSD